MAAGGADSEAERMQREERMRYEVLLMLYRVSEGATDQVVNAFGFAVDLGVWTAEVFRVVEWLARRGFVDYHGAGPAISITRAGVEYIEREGRRRSLRD